MSALSRSPVFLVVVLYSALGALGVGLYAWRFHGREGFWNPFAELTIGLIGWPGLVALVTILLAVGGNAWITKRWRSLQVAQRDIVEAFGPLPWGGIFLLALFSSVGEELFFRGYLQLEVGWLISSVIFGLVHLPPNRKWWLWPLFAMTMGAILGGLHLWTGSLLLPITVHFAINYLNLHYAYRWVQGKGARREVSKGDEPFSISDGPEDKFSG